MLKKIIMTGGTGVTGNALLKYLIDQGIEVTVLVRRNSTRRNNIPSHPLVRVIDCNLDELHLMNQMDLNDKYDAFFHLGWDGSLGKEKVDNRFNVELQYKNAGYLLDAVELCNRISCKKMIVTGTQAEYGKVKGIIDENTPLLPENAYGMAKVFAHGMADILCERYGIALIWTRLFSIYGPSDGAMSLVDVGIDSLIKHKRSIDYTSGEQMWNYLYSYDAAKALYLLADIVEKSDTFCVASEQNIPLKEYIVRLHKVVAPDIRPCLGKKQASDLIGLEVDISKLKKTTGFKESFTFEQGIRIISDEHKNKL